MHTVCIIMTSLHEFSTCQSLEMAVEYKFLEAGISLRSPINIIVYLVAFLKQSTVYLVLQFRMFYSWKSQPWSNFKAYSWPWVAPLLAANISLSVISSVCMEWVYKASCDGSGWLKWCRKEHKLVSIIADKYDIILKPQITYTAIFYPMICHFCMYLRY